MDNSRYKKNWRVVQYHANIDRYDIEYREQGILCGIFSGKRDNRNDCFILRLEGRMPYANVPRQRKVFFSDCTWEI